MLTYEVVLGSISPAQMHAKIQLVCPTVFFPLSCAGIACMSRKACGSSEML